MDIHMNQGAHVSEELAREIYEENNENFGRRSIKNERLPSSKS